MKAILIDVKNEEVREIDFNETLTHIYELVDCATFVVLRLDGVNGIYVDDEGLYAPIKYPWSFRYNTAHPPINLVNKGLVLGCDDEGESIEPDSTIESLRSSIKWEWVFDKESETA